MNKQQQRQLLLNRPNKPVETEAVRLARLEEQTRELRRTAEENLVATHAIAAAMNRSVELGERTVDTQEAHTGALATIKTVTQNIALKADQILQITSSIKKDTETLKRAWKSQGPAGVAWTVLTNERILIVTYFLAHPSFPVSSETFMAAWVIPLVINRSIRGLLWGDHDLQVPSSFSAVTYNFLVSQAALILLLHTVTKQYIELREKDPVTYTATYPGGAEQYMFNTTQWVMDTWRSGDVLSAFKSVGPDPTVSNTTSFQAVQASVDKFLNDSGTAWTTIKQVCPTLGTDKTKFASCFTEFILTSIATQVSTITPSITGYAAQIGAHLDAEEIMFGYLMQFLGKMATLAAGKTGPAIAKALSSFGTWITDKISNGVATALSNANPFKWGSGTGAAGPAPDAPGAAPAPSPSPVSGSWWRWSGGGIEDQQLQLLEERQISADEMLQSLFIMKSAARMYLLYTFANDYGNLKIEPIVKDSFETIIYYETLLLSNPSITKTPIFEIEDIRYLTSFQMPESTELLGGSTRHRTSLPTRRAGRSSSSSKRSYTRRRRALRTGKGGYRPTKTGRKV